MASRVFKGAVDQGLITMAATITTPLYHQGMTSGGKMMDLAATLIPIRTRLGTLNIKAVSHPWHQAKQISHHRLPLAAVGL